MSFAFTEYLRLFAFYTLCFIGVGTIYKNGVQYLKQKGIDTLFWIQSRYPGIYVWINYKLDLKVEDNLEKLLPFTESLQKDIEEIEDEHLKEDVRKILSRLQYLISYGQSIVEKPKDFLHISDFKLRYHELSDELFQIFEKYYYQY